MSNGNTLRQDMEISAKDGSFIDFRLCAIDEGRGQGTPLKLNKILALASDNEQAGSETEPEMDFSLEHPFLKVSDLEICLDGNPEDEIDQLIAENSDPLEVIIADTEPDQDGYADYAL